MELNEILGFNYEYNLYSTQDLIDAAAELPIHQFHSEIPEGSVLEIGYRMGGLVLYYASHGRHVHAPDHEPYFEMKLKERLHSEPYRDLVSFSITSLPEGTLPNQNFAIISICNVLHYFDFGTAQLIIDRLTNILIPGGWIVTKNHHREHLYSNNPEIVGPDREYKHFFSEEEMTRLFPRQIFTERYNRAEDHFLDEKEQEVNEYYWSLHPQHSRKWLKENWIDIPSHRDITTVHQKTV